MSPITQKFSTEVSTGHFQNLAGTPIRTPHQMEVMKVEKQHFSRDRRECFFQFSLQPQRLSVQSNRISAHCSAECCDHPWLWMQHISIKWQKLCETSSFLQLRMRQNLCLFSTPWLPFGCTCNTHSLLSGKSKFLATFFEHRLARSGNFCTFRVVWKPLI